MHLGGIDGCFKALAAGDVKAATLAGPYAEAAEAIGYRRVMPLSRTQPTLIVFNDAVDTPAANSSWRPSTRRSTRSTGTGRGITRGT